MARAEHARKGASRHTFGPDLHCINGECVWDWFKQQAKPCRCAYERPKEMGGWPVPQREDEAA